MKHTLRIPIKAAKNLAYEYGLSHVILLAYDSTNKKDHVVTYGKSLEDCSQAADFGNTLKKNLGWPESLMTQPSRVKRLQAEVERLRKQVEYYQQVFRDSDMGDWEDEYDIHRGQS